MLEYFTIKIYAIITYIPTTKKYYPAIVQSGKTIIYQGFI